MLEKKLLWDIILLVYVRKKVCWTRDRSKLVSWVIFDDIYQTMNGNTKGFIHIFCNYFMKKTISKTTGYEVHLSVNTGDDTRRTSPQWWLQFVHWNETLTYWCLDDSMKTLLRLLLKTAKKRKRESNVCNKGTSCEMKWTHLLAHILVYQLSSSFMLGVHIKLLEWLNGGVRPNIMGEFVSWNGFLILLCVRNQKFCFLKTQLNDYTVLP